jgi:hypothetical protein
MKIIPIQARPTKRYRVKLDGFKTALHIRYHATNEQWYMDLDVDELDIHVHGLALMTGTDWLMSRSNLQMGALILVDFQGNEDPDFDGLGDRWKLVYVTRAEIDDAAAA